MIRGYRPSPLFNYFTRAPTGEDRVAICKYCGGSYSYRTCTTNLKIHLKLKHVGAYTDYLARIEKSNESKTNKTVKPNTRALSIDQLWRYFRPNPEKDKMAICLLCHKSLSYRTTSSNLRVHLKHVHKDAYHKFTKKMEKLLLVSGNKDDSTDSEKSQLDNDSDIREEWLLEEVPDVTEESSEQEKETQEFHELSDSNIVFVESESLNPPSTLKKFACNGTNKTLSVYSRKQKIDESLMNYFISDYHPFKTVEEPGFKRLIHSLNNSYVLPNKNVIATSMIPTYFIKCYTEKNNFVQRNAVKVTITTDHWTSTSAECYMAVSAHFLDVNYKFISILLQCVYLGDSTTVSEIALQFNKIIIDWNLSKKVTFAATYGNFETAEAITTILGWDIFSCYARSINEIVCEAIKPFEDLITRVSVIVHHIKTNYEVSEKLLEYQSTVQKAEQPKRLKYCVRANLSSVFYMLQRFCEIRESVQAILQGLDNGPNIDDNEWISLEQLCTVLQPFEEVMQKMSVENYLAGSLAIVLTNGLLSVCHQFVNEDFNTLVMSVVETLNLELSKHFHDLENNDKLALCTLMDPRFKTYAFSDKSAAEKVKSRLINLVDAMLKSEPGSISNNTAAVEEPRAKKRFSVWDQFKETVKTVDPISSTSIEALNEVEGYLNERLLDRESCPREWWYSRRKAYPHLATICREECHVVVTSVPCSRLFTKRGQLLADRRNQLAHQEAEQLVFLHENEKKVGQTCS